MQFSYFQMQNHANILSYSQNSDFSEQNDVFTIKIWLEKRLETRY